jgi:hypothetical protein
MKKIMMILLAIALPLLPMSSALSAEATQAFGFNAASIKGFPNGGGEARLTGGGALTATPQHTAGLIWQKGE